MYALFLLILRKGLACFDWSGQVADVCTQNRSFDQHGGKVAQRPRRLPGAGPRSPGIRSLAPACAHARTRTFTARGVLRRTMERRTFGPTGQQVAVIGQGTWRVRDHAAAPAALRAGLTLGMTHIDTAELYQGSEETIRNALRERDRSDVFLVSKVLPRNASHRGTLAACAKSLQRLGTDYLDGYLLHWWGQHPIEDTMRAMAELADQGKVRSIGVSNFDVAQLDEAQRALGSKHRIACNQVPYHLLDRGIERDLVPHCRERTIAVVAYSPFGGDETPFPHAGSPEHAALERIGKKHGKTPRQVALRWVTREAHVFTIPKAEGLPHVRENAGGQGWQLDAEDLGAIDAAFPGPRPPQARLS